MCAKIIYSPKVLISILTLLSLTSCTVYTEKRSEALSRNISATVDSIDAGRFDLAGKYADNSLKLSYPPKHKIKIDSIITNKTKVNKKVSSIITSASHINLLTPAPKLSADENILRVVVPEKFKNAMLLVENSTEWNNLLKEKDFAKQLKADNANLVKAGDATNIELKKQKEMSDKIIMALNSYQKQVIQKDLVILKLWLALGGLTAVFGVCIYLRIKNIL